MNMRYGNKRIAKRLHQIVKRAGFPEVDGETLDFNLPEGFKYLGCGISRVAILHIATGVVYKVGESYANEDEYCNALNLSMKTFDELPFKFSVPKTNILYMDDSLTTVIAQQYVNGTYTECDSEFSFGRFVRTCSCKKEVCHVTARDAIYYATDIIDNHSGNILMDESGTYWLIDMA